MALEEYGEGRCVNCGYLCRMDYNGVLSRERPAMRYQEIPEHDRRQNRWHGQGVGPWCFRGIDLPSEIVAVRRERNIDHIDSKMLDELATAVVTKEDRDCALWFSYTPTFTPREHLERQRMVELERFRIETQKSLLESQQAFQAEQARLDKEWRAAQEIKAEGATQRRFRWELVVFGVIVTLILAVSQITGSLIEAGYILPRTTTPIPVNVAIQVPTTVPSIPDTPSSSMPVASP